MEVGRTATSPTGAPGFRRRKKRSLGTSNAPGSSLSGLNRSSIRVVELMRGSMGFGFTISGQKPCLLRGIVEGSPAERAGLRPGNCLVGVNGQDVSHLAHDDVVHLIGSCTTFLRLHIAVSYFSESSDEETFQGAQTRPRYPHRSRTVSKSALKKFPTHGKSSECGSSHDTEAKESRSTCDMDEFNGARNPSPVATVRRSSWDPLMPTPRKAPRPPLPYNEAESVPSRPALPARTRVDVKSLNSKNNRSSEFSQTNTAIPSVKSPVEIVSVFPHANTCNISSTSSNGSLGTSKSNVDVKPSLRYSQNNGNNSNGRFSAHSNGSNVNFAKDTLSLTELSAVDCAKTMEPMCYQVIVYYIGSVELPEIEERKRLQALSACVRRLRVEKKVRSMVLLQIQSNGISLYSSSQNVQTEPPLAFYSSSIIKFCGAYKDDRRFFGLVTCTDPKSPSSSCHVFMVDPKLLSHCEHAKRARSLGIQCTMLPVPKHAHVLGLQECSEFPATADPILGSILKLHTYDPSSEEPRSGTHRSPSEASNRLESTNSSNSDSGIGFRDESDRTSARIYDIVDSEFILSGQPDGAFYNVDRHSPVPRRKLPNLPHHKKSPSQLSQGTNSSSSRVQLGPSSGHSKHSSCSSHVSNPTSCFYSTDFSEHGGGGSKADDFEIDPSSLEEILSDRKQRKESSSKKNSLLVRDHSRDRLSLDHLSTGKQSGFLGRSSHYARKTAMYVTPPRIREKKRTSMERMTRISPHGSVNRTPKRVSLSRCGTRSLDNLCSPEILNQCQPEARNTLGCSTPTLNKDTNDSKGSGSSSNSRKQQEDFWEFKVPEPRKPKMETNRVAKWAESIEKLLADPTGLQVFTVFLEHEFSAENIHFYTSCLQFKEKFSDLTQSQRISMASTVFQQYLQNGATDSVNVDFQAQCQVEKALSAPTIDMFDLPLAQVFNLLKFDCYPRFLRSDMYRDYSNGATALPGDPSDSEESVKSTGLSSDGRRRSLLPWSIKSRSKKSQRNKAEQDGLSSNVSFIQRTADATPDCSDTEEGLRRQSYKLCRVVLPDNSTTVLPCKSGETLSTVVQRLLEKRELDYSAFEVISVSSGKALNLNTDASEITAREIRVEPRAFIGIELPHGWRVGVRANPSRKVSEVLKPILTQHSLKLDSVLVYDIDIEEKIDLKCSMGKVDKHNLLVKMKGDTKLEEITNQPLPREFGSLDGGLDDDQGSTKTTSSQSSSVFRDFLRRSSKKYKRRGKVIAASGNSVDAKDEIVTEEETERVTNLPKQTTIECVQVHNCGKDKISDEENSHPPPKSTTADSPARLRSVVTRTAVPDSPLSLLPSEFSMVQDPRNRKPIYITQSQQEEAKSSKHF